ncbi:PAS domain S-box-containing protein/diguanylate cyclase (GGDEF)-like protein [Martelella mediterranea]|uniref:PAS domain S-box-containing protein/diguanylate cyclase (GGDEF)-like protein n=2 Tax=Martelella mediterranea TaxID=293089 RepID=A0A4R3NSV8_9HYPH|nr:PAS domain S-box-containing protein/diguanylate cyclase (GGDEF)-like protein [Martelella mediterranea]
MTAMAGKADPSVRRTLVSCSFLLLIFVLLFCAPPVQAQSFRARISALIDKSPVAILILDPEARLIIAANNAASRFYGWPNTRLINMPMTELNPMSVAQIEEEIGKIEAGTANDFLFPHRFADGSIHTVHVTSWPVRIANRDLLMSLVASPQSQPKIDDGVESYSSNLEDAIENKAQQLELTNNLLTLTMISAIAILAIIVLILARNMVRNRRLAKQLGQQHLLLRVVIDAIPDQIYFKRNDGTMAACNQAAADFVGMPSETIVGKRDREIFGDLNNTLLSQQIFSKVENQDKLINEANVVNPAGREYTLEMIKAPVTDTTGERLGSVSVWRDITERRTNEARIEMLAYYDPLTQLANRVKAIELLSAYLSAHRERGQFIALAVVDLDNFSGVNSIFGHDVADQLLITAANRLKDMVAGNGFVARLSSDAFLVVMTALGHDYDEAQTQAEQIVDALQSRISGKAILSGRHISTSACIGAVLISPEASDPGEFLKRADLAMHAAKNKGRGSVSWFTSDMVHSVVENFEVESLLERALNQDMFRLFLQPKVCQRGAARHFEVLLRIEHEERGIISPEEFIDIAESTGMILPIGTWILEEAARLLSQHQDLHVSVNVSVQQLLQENFVRDLACILQSYRFDPSHLTLEMTESLMIANFDLALAQLHDIRALNVRLSIDDFGTGYSALIYLKQLPLDELKIDKTFIAGIPHEANATSLVEFIIAMARHLNLIVVAEGVETEEQVKWLRSRGCDCLQGFLFGKPQRATDYLDELN